MQRPFWAIPLGFVAGVSTIVVYLIFSLAAYLLYPSPYGPYNNWLSDLGNYASNPTGAMYYDLGVLLTGISIVIFSFCYLQWRGELKKRIGQAVLTVGIISGMAAGVSLALTGIFSLPNTQHGFLGMLFQIKMGDFIIFSTIALLRHPKFVRAIAFVALASALADLNFSILNNTPIYEWLDIGLFLVYAALMTYNFHRSFIGSASGYQDRARSQSSIVLT